MIDRSCTKLSPKQVAYDSVGQNIKQTKKSKNVWQHSAETCKFGLLSVDVQWTMDAHILA